MKNISSDTVYTSAFNLSKHAFYGIEIQINFTIETTTLTIISNSIVTKRKNYENHKKI